MADMQHVETSIGERDAIAGAPPIGHALVKFVAGENLWMEWGGQWSLVVFYFGPVVSGSLCPKRSKLSALSEFARELGRPYGT
jgi:hypothetical protein